MGAVLPREPPIAHETQVCLVHQGRRVQRVIRPLTGHAILRVPPELVVHQRQQLIHGRTIARAGAVQNMGDLIGVVGSHPTSSVTESTRRTAAARSTAHRMLGHRMLREKDRPVPGQFVPTGKVPGTRRVIAARGRLFQKRLAPEDPIYVVDTYSSIVGGAPPD